MAGRKVVKMGTMAREDLDYVRIVEDIALNLAAQVDRAVVASFNNSKDVYDRIAGARNVMYGAVRGSNLKLMDDAVWWFDGRIYVPIRKDAVGRAVELAMGKIGVGNGDAIKGKKMVMSGVWNALALYCGLYPKFHIQAFENGVVDMQTGTVYGFSPRFHVTYEHPYRFDPQAKCPMWMNFLKEVLPEKESRLILQMYLGLCTFDRGSMVDKVENCLMLYGNGSNGKSVVFEVINGIFGKENVSGVGLLRLVKGNDDRLRALSELNGKVVNVCPEIQAKDISGCEDAFKSLCSGEPQTARRIGHDAFVMYNVPWLIFNMNNMPKSTDGSYGFFRRFLYVIFNYIIPDEMQNKKLASELATEYPGILNWIRRGAGYLKQRKFIFPKSENSEKQKLVQMAESNLTLSWASARGVRCSNAVRGEIFEWIPASVLLADAQRYAELNGFPQIEVNAFGRAMTRIGFGGMNRKRVAEGVMYKVYGCSLEEIEGNEPPVVLDMDLTTEDALDAGVEYDAGDL